MSTQLNDGSLTPLYQQLMEEIKVGILSNKYVPGEKILSEMELSELYHVSRITVRRAIEELCTEGYLVKQQGKGTFVSPRKMNRKIKQMGDVMGFSEACRACGMVPGAQVLTVQRCPARADEKRFFALESDENVLYLQRVRTADGEPIMMENSFFPYNSFRTLNPNELNDASLFDYLKNTFDRTPTSTSQTTLEIVRASTELATYLDVITGDPLFYMNAYFLDQSNQPLLIGRQYIVGSRFVFSF
ncbi:GntR family transcriptional regulator [Caproiciproducens sp. R1]|uniref:GntR family transcriptional regulator n=1 Tax=Caproiciproducens sp. R1 TaxID=3435000 RepID=UPI004033D711